MNADFTELTDGPTPQNDMNATWGSVSDPVVPKDGVRPASSCPLQAKLFEADDCSAWLGWRFLLVERVISLHSGQLSSAQELEIRGLSLPSTDVDPQKSNRGLNENTQIF